MEALLAVPDHLADDRSAKTLQHVTRRAPPNGKNSLPENFR